MQRDDQKRDFFKIAKGVLRILLVTRILTMVCWQSVMKIENKRKKQLYGPSLWMGFNCLKAIQPLRGGSLLFNTKFPEILDTHLIDHGRMKG